MGVKIHIQRSHRHLHLNIADASRVLGDPARFDLTPLSVVGEYATDLRVHIGSLGSVRVMYPHRSYSQLEVSMAEHVRLFGETTKRRSSGDLEGAHTIRVCGVEIPVIVPMAHFHCPITPYLTELAELRRLVPLPMEWKKSYTTNGDIFVHLDDDQYNAVQGL